jgi:predicted acylesterase/phospholipase RssA
MPLSGRMEIRPVMRSLVESLPDFRRMARRNRKLAALEREMREALTYADWREAAIGYDREAGFEEWKLNDASPHYDFKLIQRRLAQILGAREGGYIRRLMFILQEGLHGNLGNISNPLLYQFTRFGTKRLVERYLDEVCESLDFLCDCESAEITDEEKLEFFESTSYTYGQSSLMLSGGAALGIYHMGVVKSLWENGLLPHVISGSSAGSIVAAVLGTHDDAELRELMASKTPLLGLIKWNSPPRSYLFDVEHFNRVLKERINELSFQQAFRHSGRAINITVAPYDPGEDGRLLNYRTSPNVVINSAVRASCAAPFLLPPAELLARTINGETIPYLKNRRFLDGSIGDDLPIRRLTRLYGVNHSIVSLVNPLVLPFVSRRAQRGSDIGSLTRQFATRIFKETTNYSIEMLQQAIPSENINLAIDKLQAVMMQEYRGDITLIPPRRLAHMSSLFRDFSPEEEASFVEAGMRLTWPSLEMIKNTTAISRTFRSCLERLRKPSRRRSGGRC